MAILGIDLGTTNSACAICQNGKPTLIPNRLGHYLTPSVVGLDESGELLVGEVAKNRLVSHPQETAAVFKRYMGTDHCIWLNNKSYSAVELSSLILKSLKEDAESFINETITEAVISVPAYFNDIQRKATKMAGELAGLKVDRLINEPTAAAMVYGLHERNDGSTFIILDLGGGTFDVSLVEYFDGILEVHASSGDNHLGGEDFLTLLVDDYFVQTGVNKRKLKPQELRNVMHAVEKAKQALSKQHEYSLEPIIKAQKHAWNIDRDRFEAIVQPLLKRVQLPVERTINDADIHPTEIDDVVLVGGATRMPVFRSLVSKMFRRLPMSNVDPDLVVALGAGIQAGLKDKQNELDDIVLTDVSPYSLGTEIINHNDKNGKQGGIFFPIIERNNTVPISIERTLHTAADNQSEIELNIYQGESRLVKNNVYLGCLEINIPRKPAGEESIDVRYSYDMNGLLEIDVTVCSTGQKHNKVILNAASHLSDDELARSREKLAKLKLHPRETEVNRVLMARAERLFECSLGEKREYIHRLISEFDRVLEGQQRSAITHAAKQFSAILEQLEEEGVF